MVFTPELCPPGSLASIEDEPIVPGYSWTPLFQHKCTFPPEIFSTVMMNLIRNPNINSNHLFRADISLEAPFTEDFENQTDIPARIIQFRHYALKTVIVRTMIPRNQLVDKPLDQTCLIYELAQDSGEIRSLVIYLPHISSAEESPFYHPAVRGIGFLHIFDPSTQEGIVSIHYSFFEPVPRSIKLERTALHLLSAVHKHGQGSAAGYVKRVNHDVILAQAIVQNTYARLKSKYARTLIEGWVEVTDPGKHVFEDLGIAAFLIELWNDIYKDGCFPGFVDIGCGNGLLVHILLKEGYSGWGFDARRRKSWETYGTKTSESLKELILIPSIIQDPSVTNGLSHLRISDIQTESSSDNDTTSIPGIHNGMFPKGTFIISNHADELTPWTPILATLSLSPFMMIPCCSHALSGARFRAPPPPQPSSPSPSTTSFTPTTSTFASLVAWVSKLATDAGWFVEKEMLRIPSTRNTALIGRKRLSENEEKGEVDREGQMRELVKAYGGAHGWEENAMKLVKAKGARNH